MTERSSDRITSCGGTRTGRARRHALGGAAAAAALVACAAVAAPEARAEQRPTTTLVVGTTGLGNIAHLNPLDSGWLLQGELNNLMYVPLIRNSQDDYSPAPGLAVEWGHAPDDPLTWTYRLDPTATWSDGTPITAEDARFTFEMLIENPVFNRRHGELVNNFESVEAVDDHTLVITIEQPSALMNHLNTTAIMIMPADVWSEMDDPAEYVGDPGQPTSGAFELSEFVPGERVVLTANEDWWGGDIAYDELVLQNYASPETMVQALIAGDVDLIGGLSPQQYDSLQDVEHATTSSGPGRRWHAMSFNTGARTVGGEAFGDGHPALQDPAVRRAIHHVIDKELLVEVVQAGHGVPGVGLIPPIFSQYTYDPGADVVEVSAAIGNSILDDAGYTERDDNGVRIDPVSGEPLVFRLHYHADRPDDAIITDVLVESVAELDIAIEATPMESTSLNAEHAAGRFDIDLGSSSGDPDPSADLAHHLCSRLPETVGATGLTFAFYCNEEYDELFAAQQTATDPAARAAIVHQMVGIAYHDAPQIELYYEDQLEAYNSARWTGFQTQPTAGGMIREQKGAYGYLSATPVDAPEATD